MKTFEFRWYFTATPSRIYSTELKAETLKHAFGLFNTESVKFKPRQVERVFVVVWHEGDL